MERAASCCVQPPGFGSHGGRSEPGKRGPFRKDGTEPPLVGRPVLNCRKSESPPIHWLASVNGRPSQSASLRSAVVVDAVQQAVSVPFAGGGSLLLLRPSRRPSSSSSCTVHRDFLLLVLSLSLPLFRSCLFAFFFAFSFSFTFFSPPTPLAVVAGSSLRVIRLLRHICEGGHAEQHVSSRPDVLRTCMTGHRLDQKPPLAFRASNPATWAPIRCCSVCTTALFSRCVARKPIMPSASRHAPSRNAKCVEFLTHRSSPVRPLLLPAAAGEEARQAPCRVTRPGPPATHYDPA